MEEQNHLGVESVFLAQDQAKSYKLAWCVTSASRSQRIALRSKPERNRPDHHLSRYVLRLRHAPRTQCDQQRTQAAGQQGPGCRLWNNVTYYAHGVVVGLGLIGSGREVTAEEGAIEERVLVVATGRAYAVDAAGGRIKRTTLAIADRRDIEPVVLA